MLNENLIFYKGIDYLTIGVFTDPPDKDRYDEKVLNLKSKLSQEDRTVKISSFKLEVNTKKNIYPYQLFLTFTPQGEKKHQISISLALHPRDEKIYMVKEEKYVRTPDILIEISGKALRPQNIKRTQNVINEVLRHLNANAYAFIYSRIDYCIDLYDLHKTLNFEQFYKPIVDSCRRLAKSQTIYEEEIEIYNTKRKEINIFEQVKSYKRGTSGYKEIVAYTAEERDPELLAIYEQHAEKYGLKKYNLKGITRLESRIWRDSLKEIDHSIINLRFFNQFLDLEQVISDATTVIYGTGLPDEFIKIAERPTPIFKFKNQLTGTEKINKLTISKINKADATIEDLIKQLIGTIRAISHRIATLSGTQPSPETAINFIIEKLKSRELIKYLIRKYEETSDIFYYNLKKAIKNPSIKTLILQQLKDLIKVVPPVLPETEKYEGKFFKNLDPPDDLIPDL